ncbi:MAG: hypothetical protein ACI87E_003930 [Mariniblastus sp.]|jgi:hypothetical protein
MTWLEIVLIRNLIASPSSDTLVFRQIAQWGSLVCQAGGGHTQELMKFTAQTRRVHVLHSNHQCEQHCAKYDPGKGPDCKSVHAMSGQSN